MSFIKPKLLGQKLKLLELYDFSWFQYSSHWFRPRLFNEVLKNAEEPSILPNNKEQKDQSDIKMLDQAQVKMPKEEHIMSPK